MAVHLHIPVIGSGSIGNRHYNNLLKLGVRSELLSYREMGTGGVELYLNQGVDGIVIATATGIRNELISICAEHNVPMYIEKPVAFTSAQVDSLYQMCPEELQCRSMAGYMMRYHPLFRRLCDQSMENLYRFNMTIGHDVTQWRSNWRFSESYAASPAGGGVLLDLCHELDMAHTLVPELAIRQVTCLGHRDYPGVDFNTEVSLTNNKGIIGSVNMDYLSPVSTRVASFYSRDVVVRVDLGALSYQCNDGQEILQHTISFERNDMFFDALKDFIRLIKGETVNHWCPRLDRAKKSAAFIADAWQQRHFTGRLSHTIL